MTRLLEWGGVVEMNEGMVEMNDWDGVYK